MADEDDKVGFKNPPRKHQFKKGQSGNPKGRPRISADLNQMLFNELDRAIALTQSGQTQEVSVREAIVKNLIAGAIKGNLRCLKIILRHLPRGETRARFVKVDKGSRGDRHHE